MICADEIIFVYYRNDSMFMYVLYKMILLLLCVYIIYIYGNSICTYGANCLNLHVIRLFQPPGTPRTKLCKSRTTYSGTTYCSRL